MPPPRGSRPSAGTTSCGTADPAPAPARSGTAAQRSDLDAVPARPGRWVAGHGLLHRRHSRADPAVRPVRRRSAAARGAPGWDHRPPHRNVGDPAGPHPADGPHSSLWHSPSFPAEHNELHRLRRFIALCLPGLRRAQTGAVQPRPSGRYGSVNRSSIASPGAAPQVIFMVSRTCSQPESMRFFIASSLQKHVMVICRLPLISFQDSAYPPLVKAAE
jgi:hypothetical protein